MSKSNKDDKNKKGFNVEQAEKDKKEPLSQFANAMSSAGIVKTLLEDIKHIIDIFK